MAVLLIVKASLVLLITLSAARLLGRSAATRHAIWSAGFAALLALPLLALLLPRVDVPIPAAWRAADAAQAVRTTVSSASNVDERSLSAAAIAAPAGPSTDPGLGSQGGEPRISRPSAGAVLGGVWVLGTAAAVVTLLVSLMRARRLAAGTGPAGEGWVRAAETMRRRAGVRRRVRLVISDRVRAPMAGGWLRPVVFLPSSAITWTAERRDVVLAHELAHLASADPLRHVAARLAVALYWFHPLAWLAAREATLAREEACDQSVLGLGLRPSSYAQVLLDFADSAGPRPVAALPIVDRSSLERRLMAILAHEPGRIRPSRPLVPFAIITLLAAAVAAAHPDASVPPVRVAAVAAVPTATVPAVPAATIPAASAATVSAVSAAAVPDVPPSQSGGGLDRECRARRGSGRSLTYEQTVSDAGDRAIVKSFGDLQLCMAAEGVPDDRSRPSEWSERARQMVIEARHGGAVQRLESTRDAAGGQRVQWQVGAVQRPFDAAAEAWRERMLAVLDAMWDLSTLRGDVSALQGEISAVHGQESALRGQISSLAGELSTMHGRLSTIRGEESALRGEISQIRGHASALSGAISSERGAISALEAMRRAVDGTELAAMTASIRRHEAEILRLEKELRDYGADAKTAAVEQRLRAFDADRKAAAVQAEIQAFDLDAKVAAVERLIQELSVPDKVAALERKIAQLNADLRDRTLQQELTQSLQRLRELLDRLK